MQPLFDWIERRYKNGKLLWDLGQAGLAAMSIGIPAWAASASAWLNAWGPIAWVAAGFGGFLCFVVSLWILGKFRDNWISSTIKRRFYEGTTRINPLETVFSHVRISIEDLLPPLVLRVNDKTFINCDIVGPAQIYLERSTMTNSGGESIDAVIGRPGASSMNGIFFINCAFRDCRFYRVTFLILESDYDLFVKDNPNVGFITHVPTGQAPLPMPVTQALSAPKGGVGISGD